MSEKLLRTLEEMKRSRGGFCFNCGKDIMDPSEKDHSFCNACWWELLHHKFIKDNYDPEAETCDSCGEPPEDELHAQLSPYQS